ncbi:MAG TPA: dihydrofolate reductase family protein [Gemmatimonadaceae bacterium]|nr:dihydrofolate reductase family protein [Gemmatimonadaceae bacterium]
MRKIIAQLAISIDGFIARPDGAVDWLDRPVPPSGYGMSEFMRSVDTLVMGRDTWDVGVKLGGGVTKGMENIILSRTLDSDAIPGAIIESGDATELAKKWRAKKGKDIWLMGGAKVFGAFLDAGQIDELMMHVVPVAIGVGIPLLDPKSRTTQMKLLGVKEFEDGVVQLRYGQLPGKSKKKAHKAPA